MKKTMNISVEKVAIKDIVLWDENPRIMLPEAWDGLRCSLEKFGYVSLLVVNKKDMRLLSGHQRIKIMREAKIERAPVVLVEFDYHTANALSLTLNNQMIRGRWKKDISEILKTLIVDGSEFINLRLEALQKESADIQEVIDKYIKEKEVDENIPTFFKCPECSYVW